MRVTVVQYVCENIFEGLEKAAHHKCPWFLTLVMNPHLGLSCFIIIPWFLLSFFAFSHFFRMNPPSRVVLFTDNLWFYLTFSL